MILIASGAYLQGEFATEVGLLPPSFLPIGNKRLYEYQLDFLRKSEPDNSYIYLSIPASYELDAYDALRLSELGVIILRVPVGLSLGESILFCWNATAMHHVNLTLLHGDTLFLNSSFKGTNTISVHENRGFYKRATLGNDSKALEEVHDEWSSNSEHVISGYFKFENPLFLMKSLVEAKSDFIKGVVHYHLNYPMSLSSEGDWLDFGHINSFFQARTLITTQRAFNELSITSRSVTKASKSKANKIFAEGNWFDKLPLNLRMYTPALLGLTGGEENYEGAAYQLEYLYLLPLSDLFVFSRLTSGSWGAILNAVLVMLEDFSSYYPASPSSLCLSEFDSLYLPKTLQRLEDYQHESSEDRISDVVLENGNTISLVDLAKLTAEYIKPTQAVDVCLVHGDLCFSNLLFDSRIEAVKCIDPRGLTPNGKLSLYGDRRYDLAKLYHSIIGFYDLIIAGRYSIEINDNGFYKLLFNYDEILQKDISNSFKDIILSKLGYSEKEILSITIHLFLSMLPLHSDRPDRQRAFIANAVRLYARLEELNS